MSQNTYENKHEILSFAEMLAGEDADRTILTAMCGAAASELEARLRDGVSAEALGSTFSMAAGVLAMSMYCAVERPEKIRSFRAGDVSVNYGGEATAESLRSAAEALLAAYLRDRGFAFQGVQG